MKLFRMKPFYQTGLARMLSLSILISSSPAAYAGLFDFLPGGDAKKEEKKEEPAPPKASAAEAASSKADKGCLSGKLMTGRELLVELRAIRGAFSAQSPDKALAALIAPPPAAKAAPKGKAAPAGKSAPPRKTATKTAAKTATAEPQTAKQPAANNDPCAQVGALAQLATGLGGSLGGGAMGSMTSILGDVVLDALTMEMSYRAIDTFFGQLVDDKDILAKVSVEVPDLSNLDPGLRKSVLNLSAFLVAIKASGAIMDAGQKDFDTAKESYKKVMAARAKAAEILADAYLKREQAAELRAGDKKTGSANLGKDGEELLRQLEGRSAEDIVKDARFQTLAIQWMKQHDPEAYRGYSADFGEMKSHYGAYLRTATGSASMLGFSAVFLKKAKNLAEQQGAVGALVLASLLPQALSEVVSIAPRVAKTISSGDDMVAGSFAIEREGKPWKQGMTAKSALNALNEGEVASFRANAVNGAATGYLASLSAVAPSAAATLADRVVKKENKKLLAESLNLPVEPGQFSFSNLVAAKDKAGVAAAKNIRMGLYLHTPRMTGPADNLDPRDKALALAQKDLLENFDAYENGDLRKLLFAASDEKNLLDPKMALASATIRLDSLGMDGLIDQEAMLAERMKTGATTMKYGVVASAKNALKRKSR